MTAGRAWESENGVKIPTTLVLVYSTDYDTIWNIIVIRIWLNTTPWNRGNLYTNKVNFTVT